MTTLVLGANSILGWHLLRNNPNFVGSYNKKYPNFLTNSLSKLDVTSTLELERIITSLKPTTIINCTGLTDVDVCETLPEFCFLLNCITPLRLAELCRTKQIRFIQISTDHFQASKEDLNSRHESAGFYPINQYGLSKLTMEKFVLNENPQALIVRTNFFGFSPGKATTFGRAVRLEDKFEQFSGFYDVLFNPVGISYLVAVLTLLVNSDLQGTQHVVSTNSLSKLDFLRMAVEARGGDPAVITPESQSTLKVRRPNFLSLKPSQRIFDMAPPPSIDDMIAFEVENHLRFEV